MEARCFTSRMTAPFSKRDVSVPINLAIPAAVLAVVGLAHPHQLSVVTAQRWYIVHILLLMLFPLLVVPLLWLVRAATLPVRTAVTTLSFLYAVFYGAQDAIAGIGLGSVMNQTTEPEKITTLQPTATMLFDESNGLAVVGLWCFLVAAILTSLEVLRRRRAAAAPGALLLCAGAISFLDSHVYWPRGVITMLAIAAGAAALGAVSTASSPAPAARREPNGRGRQKDGLPRTSGS